MPRGKLNLQDGSILNVNMPENQTLLYLWCALEDCLLHGHLYFTLRHTIQQTFKSLTEPEGSITNINYNGVSLNINIIGGTIFISKMDGAIKTYISGHTCKTYFLDIFNRKNALSYSAECVDLITGTLQCWMMKNNLSPQPLNQIKINPTNTSCL